MTAARYFGTPQWYFPNVDPRTTTGDPLRWGVIATGAIAHKVTSDLALLEDAELYAVSSRSTASAQAFALQYGFAKHYANDDDVSRPGGKLGFERLLADPNVDVVYIATPHAQHHKIALAALRAGKHVLCEKALTINAAEARELVAAAAEANVFLMEAMWARFVPGIQRAMEIVASGELGEVQWVRADLGFPSVEDPSARLWAPADGGGALLDLTIYPLLWAWGTLGAPDAVNAVGTKTALGVDSQNAITLSYNSGAIAQLTSYLRSLGPRTAVVSGTKGYLQATGSINNPDSLRIYSSPEDYRDEDFSIVGNGYAYELREVTWCIQRQLRESPTMPLADSLATMELFDSVRSQLGVVYPNDAR
ncbi:MAG: Gfo/Idh/MocA family oxidoreductase [Acidobacteria bacterium]|nr:Gfo/Idh/MocA family oxidoreductase [Acidobacteriota bacterium]